MNKMVELCENADYPRTEDDLKKFANVFMAKQTHKKDENIDKTNETSNIDSKQNGNNDNMNCDTPVTTNADDVESELMSELNERLNDYGMMQIEIGMVLMSLTTVMHKMEKHPRNNILFVI